MNLCDLQTLSTWCDKNLAAFSFDQVPDIQQSLHGLKRAVDTKVASLQALQKVIQQVSASGHCEASSSSALVSAAASSDEKYGDEITVSLDQIRLRGVTSSLVPDSTVLEGLSACNGRYVVMVA